jgi:plasmid stabilization system protein ParE
MLREKLAAIVAAQATADRAVVEFLELARGCEAGDSAGAGVVFEVAEAIGRCGQGLDGQLVQALAQADRISARKGVLKPWIATHLDVSDSKARGIAEAARRIGAIPELAEPLSSGRVGTDTVRALCRTAKAIEGTGQDTTAALIGMLEVSARDGVSAANREIRELEHTLDPGSSQELLGKQRARSFARVIELEDGRCRVEALLDPVRATIVRSAMDQAVSAWIREGQYDGTDPLPEDVRTTEQMNAHALVRMAEVFVMAPSQVRGVKFSPPMLFTAPLNEADGGLAETVYGTVVPVAGIGDLEAHLLEHDADGVPVMLDGVTIDADPTARLASPAQRTALAFRDRHCTYPGCTRPPTWSLHAHHRTPHSKNGPTTMRNLTQLCPEHHVLIHQPAA